MRRFGTYGKRYWFLYLVAMISMVVSILLDAASPQITKGIIDKVIVGGQMEKLTFFLLGLLGIGLGRGVLQYIKEFIFDFAASGIGSQLRKELFDHIQSLSVGYFDSHNTGELMARVKDDVDRIWNACGFVGMLVLECLIHTTVIVFCMFRLSPLLTMVPLLAMPVIAFFAVKMENGLGAVYDKISEETAQMNTTAQENLAGVRTVKAFAREPYEIKKFMKHNQKFYDLNMEQARLTACYQPGISFVAKVFLMAVIVAGGILVIKGKMTIGELGAFSEYANNIIWPMEMAGWLSNDLAAAVASGRKIQGIFAEKPEIREMEDEKLEIQEMKTKESEIQEMKTKESEIREMETEKSEIREMETEKSEIREMEVEKPDKVREGIKGRIQFEHVDFSLHGMLILKDITFDLPAGKTLGIMGMTGSGKTTIVNLIQRFYDVSAGEIRIDGANIQTFPLSYLRGQISVVMQDVFLFSDSISENIKTGKKAGVSHEEVERAAVCADAHDFIMKLGQQYETVIGERGVGLSGGQKQRISIARAIAKKNPVLILDDATSALDTETEKEIERQLEDLKDSTKIIIGHRISSVRHADEILILDKGQIAERGSHKELMEKKGLYYLTWQVQYGEEDERCR